MDLQNFVDGIRSFDASLLLVPGSKGSVWLSDPPLMLGNIDVSQHYCIASNVEILPYANRPALSAGNPRCNIILNLGNAWVGVFGLTSVTDLMRFFGAQGTSAGWQWRLIPRCTRHWWFRWPGVLAKSIPH